MTHIRVKLSVAGLVLLMAVSYLAYAGVQRGWVYTLGVDQYLASPEQLKLTVRLCGTVSSEQLEVHKAELSAHFLLQGEHAKLPVEFKGAIPDMFKAGGEVVIEGKLDSAGLFHASQLMTKCASKYEGVPQNHPPINNSATLSKGGQP